MNSLASAPDATAQIGALIVAVLLLDEHSVIAQVNPAAEELLGRSAPRLMGETLFDVVAMADARIAESLRRSDTQMIARGMTIGAAQGERRIHLTSSPMPDHPGWRVVTLSDAGADAGGDAEDDFELRAPAVLAHEIKNPLAAIRGASQLLARRVEAADKQLTRMIADEVDRIAQLIDRMQQLGSRPSLEIESCNPHEAIRKAMATVRSARHGAIELAEEFDPSLPPVAADRAALEQVLINLLSNACDACDGVERVRVTVRTRFASSLVFNAIRLGKPARLPIEITVTDSGPGVDPALAEHIFEPFVSSKPRGQGLGLALVRKLLRDMGGRIAHERDARAGLTHFRVNLPVAGGGGSA